METGLLQDAAGLALQALLARLDPEMGARPFFWVDFRTDPPEASHSYWDYVDIAGRYVDGLILARALTGSEDGRELERMLREFLWERQDPGDGLFYIPEERKLNVEMSKYAPDAVASGAARHVDMFCQRAPLLAMCTLLAAGEQGVQPRLERMVRGLAGIAEGVDDGIRFPTYRWAAEIRPEWYAGESAPERWLGYRYALLTGLARYVELSDDRVARDLAIGLARYYMAHGDVPADGRFHGNTHSGGILPTTVGIARLGRSLGDSQMLEWAQRVYLWVREQTPDFGFLVDGLGLEGVFAHTCETCGIADLLHLAIVLTEAGLGAYWDDTERYARNQLLENQYRDATALRRAFPRMSDRVLSMLWGGFEAAAQPNSLMMWDGAEGCCIGGGLRALYLAWRASVAESGSETRVNMGFSRGTAHADVVGHEPWEGRVEVRVRSPRSVLIRAPEHAGRELVRAMVDDVEVVARWDDGYLRFDGLEPGQVASIVYPMREFESGYRIGEAEYVGRWRGSTMLSIEPQGRRYPIYRRQGLLREPERPARLGMTPWRAEQRVSLPVLW